MVAWCIGAWSGHITMQSRHHIQNHSAGKDFAFSELHSSSLFLPLYFQLLPPLMLVHLLSPAVLTFYLCFLRYSFGNVLSPPHDDAPPFLRLSLLCNFFFRTSSHLLFLPVLGNFLCVVCSFGAPINCSGLVVVMPSRTQMQSLHPLFWQSLTFSTALFLSLLSSCSRAWIPWPFVSLFFLFRPVPLLPHRIVLMHSTPVLIYKCTVRQYRSR